MSVLKTARQKAGYDNEEFWFHQKDRELIEKIKKPHLQLIKGGADHQSEKSETSEKVEEVRDKKAA